MAQDDNDLQRAGRLGEPEADAVTLSTPADELDKSTPRLGTFIDAALERMGKRTSGEESAIATPWPTLNEKLAGGLWPGLHVLVGNTGSGKSQLALQLALHAAQAGTPALYVGLELDELDLTARLAGLLEHKHWSDFYHGKRQAQLDTREHLKALPFYLDLRGPHDWTPGALDAPAQALKAQTGGAPFLVVLDFLQIVGDGGQRLDARQRIGEAAYQGTALARKYGAAVLMLSSTARENAHALRGERRPSGKSETNSKPEPLGTGWPGRFQNLGKESGEIEYSADTLLALCEQGHEGTGPWPRWLAVAKIRAGVPGWVELRFDGNCFGEPTAPRHEKL